MKNQLFVMFAVILYVIIIILLARKAKDIFNNPKKYNEIKGWRKYRDSFWYEPLEYYHKSLCSKNYLAPIIVGIPLMFGLLISYFIVGYLIQKYIFMPAGVVFLHGEGLWIGALGTIFFDIVLEFWIIFHCKSPIMIACSMNAFSSKSRSGDWKKLVCGMLVVSIVCLPLMFAGINTYAYASDKEVVLNKFMQISEKHIWYKDIESIETEYRSNKDQTEYYFSYFITIEDNEEKIDVLEYCAPGAMIYIHNQIMDENVAMKKGIIQNDIYQEMKKVIGGTEVEMVEELFEID